ncbi:gliding motility-associated C-terminal domain-containing protein [Labilibacter marinus]|uniref:gliding motility-associated C-terminal domain-containing protein n=1 Tax=Labilibacter marinus TaxID=1477105 RepID=UPI000830E6F5|nr:gliding motility-associated C-terminal domain-containing protein [Labilibacter marinus]
MNTFFKYILSFTLLLAATCASAQIISTGHTDTQETKYTENDLIYLYPNVETGALTATPPVGGINVTYTWEKYNSGNWDVVMTGTEPSLTDLSDGGYRVTVNNNGTIDRQDVCWTFQPEILSLKADSLFSNCNNIQLIADISTKTLEYYNPSNGDYYTVDYNISYNWTSEPSIEDAIPDNSQPLIEPPYEEMFYYVDASAFNDAHKLTGESLHYNEEPIAVKAIFTFNVLDRENENELPENTEFKNIKSYTGSAGIICFINDSAKGLNKSYQIDFRTDDGEEKPSEDDLIEVRFDKIGTYHMDISVKNDVSGCKDTESLGPIKVEEIYLDAPNVFTPDGDGTNDKFMVVYSSIKDFKMVIFNRWGRKVFQTTNPGDAWDGKIAGKDAAEGVYFYVITATGFNQGESRKLENSLHLFRGN